MATDLNLNFDGGSATLGALFGDEAMAAFQMLGQLGLKFSYDPMFGELKVDIGEGDLGDRGARILLLHERLTGIIPRETMHKITDPK